MLVCFCFGVCVWFDSKRRSGEWYVVVGFVSSVVVLFGEGLCFWLFF